MTSRRRSKLVAVEPPLGAVPRDYRNYLPLVRAVALDVESDVTRGALADWLDETGFPAEAAAVRALAGLRWHQMDSPRVQYLVGHPVGHQGGYDRGWARGGAWRAWLWRDKAECGDERAFDAARADGRCDTLDDGKACVVAALIENRRWCEGE